MARCQMLGEEALIQEESHLGLIARTRTSRLEFVRDDEGAKDEVPWESRLEDADCCGAQSRRRRGAQSRQRRGAQSRRRRCYDLRHPQIPHALNHHISVDYRQNKYIDRARPGRNECKDNVL